MRTAVEEVSGWLAQARHLLAERSRIAEEASAAGEELRRAAIDVPRDGATAWRVLPLRKTDEGLIRALALRSRLPDLSEWDAEKIQALVAEGPGIIGDARVMLGVRRFLSRPTRRSAAAEAGALLIHYRDQAAEIGLPGLLSTLTPDRDSIRGMGVADALDPGIGLAEHLGAPGSGGLELLDGHVVAGLGQAIVMIDQALQSETAHRAAAVQASDQLRRAETRGLLTTMPVDRLREATSDRLRVNLLTDDGITTVQAVLDRGRALEGVSGIGSTLAARFLGAAQALRQSTYDEMPVRIDIRRQTSEATRLLRLLGAWDATRRLRNAAWDLARARELAPLAQALDRHPERLAVVPLAGLSAEEFLTGVNSVLRRAASVSDVQPGQVPAADPWEDFLARPADYLGMLTELGVAPEDENRIHGDLPEQIVAAVRATSLNVEYLTVGTLRGYQSFGARFALVRRKVIIGDEMGLGKTVEALAVLAHLRAYGHRHTIVVCPAAVVTNWTREIMAKSTMDPHRVHGPRRDAAVDAWRRDGGVAVTTYETLRWLLPQLHDVELGCVVVDEAHYIKNPDRQRSQLAAQLLEMSDRALLLTGTPLENRLDEFVALVRHVQPRLVIDTSGVSPLQFRTQVAPAYLRRNQADVLPELPPLVEVDEVLPMSDEDLAAYQEAVRGGNFMAMRRAAMIQGRDSEKFSRLMEIVAEAVANGRRVLVFSFFRDVLDQVKQELPGQVFGPLTGKTPVAQRQPLLDEFSAADGGAVLVASILAAGMGLNLQAASVVILCEPQLKPSTEEHAIRRAQRMGQLESVQVYRLLSEEGVDQRIRELLARKGSVFDEFARVSATADSAPEALDVSENKLVHDIIVAAERARLFADPTAG
ncbi:DEAD/DEAH box helicase [Parafrankia sp. FMc6]|uniref:DEAD/DEAH box helicase n=1 Tax=Parafrankia soli TaxID=2599596 RepID=UPI0034D56BD9